MAIGSRYNPGSVPNYIQMGEQSERNALQNAQGAANLFNTGMKTMHQIEDRARLEEARQAFDAAWMSKDPDDIQRVIARFPEYAAKIQQSIGIRDDQQRQQVGSMAIQLQGMLESGNIEGAQDIVRQNARLFPTQGSFSAENVASNIGIAAQDPKKMAGMKDWAQRLSLSTLSPKEIVNYGLSQQQMAQQLEMQKNALEQQLQISRNSQALGWARLNEMADFRNTSPTQRLFEWFSTLSPEEQKIARSLMPGGGVLGAGRGGVPGGMQKAQLTDGRIVDIYPKVQKQGSHAFYQGLDAEGNMINVPVDSIVSSSTAEASALSDRVEQNLNKIINSTDDQLKYVANVTGSTGGMPIGAGIATGMSGDPAARDAFNAISEMHGLALIKAVGQAKEAGASGINTMSEFNTFKKGVANLDTTSPEQLRKTAKDLLEQYRSIREKKGVNLDDKKQGSSDASNLSDEELLSGL